MLVRGISGCNVYNNKEASFGWGHKVHETLSLELCKKYNKALRQGFIDVDIIKDACSHPDSFIPTRQHFANVHRFSSKDKTTDAFTMAQRCYSDALRYHSNGNHKKRDRYFGFLLHFGQDTFSLPHATRFREFIGNNPERTFHSDYEARADMRVNEILKQMRAQNQRPLQPSGNLFKELELAMQKTQNSLTELVRASGYPSGTSIQELPDEVVDNVFKELNRPDKPKEMVKVLKKAMDDSLRNTYEITERFFADAVARFNEVALDRIAVG